MAIRVRNLDQKQFSATTSATPSTETPVAHNLGRTPKMVVIEPTTGAAPIFQSTPADATNVFLKSTAASQACNVTVLA